MYVVKNYLRISYRIPFLQTLERGERQENATAEPEATTVPEPGPTATPEPEGTATPEPQPKVTTTQESDPTTEQECADLDCENGGTAFSNSSGVCQCRCTDEYQGTFCDRTLITFLIRRINIIFTIVTINILN